MSARFFAPRPGSLTAASLWRPWGWRSRLLGAIFFAAQLFMALGDQRSGVIPGLGDLPPLLALATALVLLGLPLDDPYPRRLSLAVAGLAITLTALEAPAAFSSGGLYADWHLGASTFVLMVLALRAPIVLVWAAFLVLALVEGAVVVVEGGALLGSAFELARHAASIATAWVAAIGIGRTAVRLREVAERRAEREAEEAVRREVARARAAQLERIEATAGSLLRSLQQPSELSASERAECLLAEASLRDAMSGRGLASAEVAAAARSARERGVRVVLLDDSNGSHPQRAEVGAAIVTALAELEPGDSLVARLQPSGRPLAATITIDAAAGGRVLELPATEVGRL